MNMKTTTAMMIAVGFDVRLLKSNTTGCPVLLFNAATCELSVVICNESESKLKVIEVRFCGLPCNQVTCADNNDNCCDNELISILMLDRLV